MRRENVEVSEGAMGELSVSFAIYGWFPDVLPSEDDEDEPDEAEIGG